MSEKSFLTDSRGTEDINDTSSKSASMTPKVKLSRSMAIPQTQDELEKLTDDQLIKYMGNGTKIIKNIYELLWSSLSDKRKLANEFLRRYSKPGEEEEKNVTNNEVTVDALRLVNEKITSKNEFIKLYVNSVEDDNALTVTVIEDSVNEWKFIQSFEELLNKSINDDYIDEYIDEYDQEDQELVSLKNEFKAQMESRQTLIGKLYKLTPDFRMKASAGLKLSSDYILENMRNERDEIREQAYLLQKCSKHQNRLILDLTRSISLLKNKIAEYETNEENNVMCNSTKNRGTVASSVAYTIEPLQKVCNLYSEEFRRGVRLLTNVLRSVKDEVCLVNSSAHASHETLPQTHTKLIKEILDLIKKCTGLIIDAIQSNIDLSQPEEVINGVFIKLKLLLHDIEHVKSRLEFLLAQTVCDESTV